MPVPDDAYSIPKGGSLGLLAAGYRGLRAWREVRGEEWKRAFPAPEPTETAIDASLTIVSGLPRSGTSMLMQMLVAAGLPAFSDGDREADESNPRGYFEHEKVKALARDASWLPEADGHALKVVAPLLPHLPPGPSYRVIYVDRDLDEVIRSQAAMLARDDRQSAATEALRVAYARYDRAARDWMHTHASSLVLSHATVLADPLAAASRVTGFLGSTADAREVAAVVDPSLHRQRA